MPGDKDAIATIAVKDVKLAGKFYEGTLCLKKRPAMPGVLSYRSGNSTVLYHFCFSHLTYSYIGIY